MKTVKWNNKGSEMEYPLVQELLTKREYFAGLAMQALCSNSNNHYMCNSFDSKMFAKIAVEQADALISELNKESNE